MALSDLGVVSIGKVTRGLAPSEVIRRCIQDAIVAEECGYKRFWVSEHHEMDSAWGSPSLILSAIGQRTNTIRLGTAAIILALHRPVAIAEQFFMLSAMYPERVDCGVGGKITDPAVLQAYQPESAGNPGYLTAAFPRAARELQLFLNRHLPLHRPVGTGLSPMGAGPPSLWIMAVDGTKRRIAAELGTSLSYSIFHTRSQRDPAEIKAYRDAFVPNAQQKEPFANLAVNVICASTAADAQACLVRCGIEPSTVVHGTAADCLDQLHQLADAYDVSEVIVRFRGDDALFVHTAMRLLAAHWKPHAPIAC
jgi:luciferase family oxidoreductase group 1